jgi:hypothetical protein
MNRETYLFLLPDSDWLEHLPVAKADVSNSFLITQGPVVTAARLRERGYLFAEIVLLESYLDTQSLEAAVCSLFKKSPFARIIAPDEIDILRAAHLRELLGIEGQSVQSARAFQDKLLMKELIRQAGLPVPYFQKIKTLGDIQNFINTYGTPVVVKPSIGTGCQGILIIHNAQEVNRLDALQIFSSPHDVMIESFVEGKMYHIDGLMREGELLCVWPFVYLHPAINILHGEYASSCMLSPDTPLTPLLNQYATEVLKALPTPQGMAFHLEVFVTEKEQEIIFCEIACRVGGKGVNQAWEASFQIDLKREFLTLQCGLSGSPVKMPSRPRVISGEVWFPKVQGLLKHIETNCPFDWVKDYQIYAENGDCLTTTGSLDDLLGGSPLLIGKSQQEVEERIRLFGEWFQRHTRIVSPVACSY